MPVILSPLQQSTVDALLELGTNLKAAPAGKYLLIQRNEGMTVVNYKSLSIWERCSLWFGSLSKGKKAAMETVRTLAREGNNSILVGSLLAPMDLVAIRSIQEALSVLKPLRGDSIHGVIATKIREVSAQHSENKSRFLKRAPATILSPDSGEDLTVKVTRKHVTNYTTEIK